jgi:hypothetical protein
MRDSLLECAGELTSICVAVQYRKAVATVCGTTYGAVEAGRHSFLTSAPDQLLYYLGKTDAAQSISGLVGSLVTVPT